MLLPAVLQWPDRRNDVASQYDPSNNEIVYNANSRPAGTFAKARCRALRRQQHGLPMALDFSLLNVMIVDDNPHMRILIRSILLGFGVKNIHECPDGSEAIAELHHWPADIVFADWMMEPLDGLDFTRLIRTADDSPNRFVPIIMLTGHTERHRIVEARDAGVTEFLVKPVTANGLYARLRSVIENPRQFVQSQSFSGPDRRRRTEDLDDPDRRKD